jgi:hypothetical protein
VAVMNKSESSNDKVYARVNTPSKTAFSIINEASDEVIKMM